MGLPACLYSIGVGVGMRLDEGAKILEALGILVFPASPGAGGEVLQTADAVLEFV